MKAIYKQLIPALGFIAICSIFTTSGSVKNHKRKSERFQHAIQLQLSDSAGFPVPGTEFWVTLDIIQEGPKVTIQLPVINFQTGPVSPNDPEYPETFVPGGYLYTCDGFLPECVRPNDLVDRSFLVPSNNGTSLPFSFAELPPYLPKPPVGYILQVTNAGALVVQAAGTFGNVIPPGPQILLPTDITYIVKPKKGFCNNVVLSTGATNTTQFTNPAAAADGFRDLHVNDAFDGIVAFSWADNSTVLDKTNGTMNLMVAIGKVDCGKLKIGAPIQLTNLAPNIGIFNSALAINRTNKNNIVVSYGVIDDTSLVGTLYRAVSFDGGKNWPLNGPLTIQPIDPLGFGDCRGVSCDAYGNFWYSYTRFSDGTPSFQVSSNEGEDFKLVYTAPIPTGGASYDYPQYCFGGNGLGQYGLHFAVDYFPFPFEFVIPAVGFIEIKGLGNVGAHNFKKLHKFKNVCELSDITASADGRVWLQGFPLTGSSYIQPAGVLFKSPGLLDVNYAGLWHNVIYNGLAQQFAISPQDSQPVQGYIPNSVKSILYDDTRQALYALYSAQFPDNSQNARIYFSISRDNGQTWSSPIDISTTDFANRGFQSMALDPITGNLVFGWYDGRNDPTFQSVEYFGAVLPAKRLDALVNEIPLSNPLYTLPPATLDDRKTIAKTPEDEKLAEALKLMRQKRVKDRLAKGMSR